MTGRPFQRQGEKEGKTGQVRKRAPERWNKYKKKKKKSKLSVLEEVKETANTP